MCVLRIGDFINTKVVINTLSISYEPFKLDLNRDGIGIQPMIASVSLGIDIIGGQHLDGPINNLQNALSFEFYANTHLYDPRSKRPNTAEQLDQIPTQQTPLEINRELPDLFKNIQPNTVFRDPPPKGDFQEIDPTIQSIIDFGNKIPLR